MRDVTREYIWKGDDMGFTHTHIWTGRRLTVGDLRELAAKTAGMSITETVEVRVGPSFNNPTDPGGEITIEITANELREK